ncbi:MAG TPA: helix-turn-helix domain-containing protein [Cytophagales bacterium]|jgi:AraC-like DNA-binding protein
MTDCKDVLDYYEYPLPDSPLTWYVDCVYFLRSEAGGSYFCVPNGKLGVSLVLTGHLACQGEDGHPVPLPRAALFGLVTEPVQVHVSAGFSEVAIILKPNGLQHFTNLSFQELMNPGTPLEAVLGSGLTDLHERLGENEEPAARVAMIEKFLLGRLGDCTADARVDLAVGEILRHKGAVTVDGLCRQLRVTPRTLSSLFREKVGVSPKVCMQLTRFYNALSYQPAGGCREETLAGLACALGYYDQAHFIKDFKRFAGRSPQRYFSCAPLAVDFRKYRRWLSSNFMN